MIPFAKLHGAGNDFIVLDAIANEFGSFDLRDLARAMCHRRFGVGADGLILLGKRPDGILKMRLINSDGSEGGMCGNGLRCLALRAKNLGYVADGFECEIGDRIVRSRMQPDGTICVDMGRVSFRKGEIGMSGNASDQFLDEPIELGAAIGYGCAAFLGNPHLTLFVDDPDALDLEVWGPKMERHPGFPNRTNVHFVRVEGPDRIYQRTWERGAGATWACGSGACCVVACAAATGRTSKRAHVRLTGGSLVIELDDDWNAQMAGPALQICEGVYEPTPLAQQ